VLELLDVYAVVIVQESVERLRAVLRLCVEVPYVHAALFYVYVCFLLGSCQINLGLI
jgi:hypothetical protein